MPGIWFPRIVIKHRSGGYVKAEVVKWDARTRLKKAGFKPRIPDGYDVTDEVAGIKYTKGFENSMAAGDIIEKVSLNEEMDRDYRAKPAQKSEAKKDAIEDNKAKSH